MSIENTIIIPATTEEATSNKISAIGTTTINAGTLQKAEYIKIQYSHDGVEWKDLLLNGIIQRITYRHSLITILGPGLFRAVKTETENPVSVAAWFTEAE